MKTLLRIFFIFTLAFVSCKKDDKETVTTFEKDKISGSSQKGPFLNGSALTVLELNAYDFSQTGQSFNTQILDNLGSFEIANLSLVSPYAKLKADGFYFNEITNANSIAPISLYALSDLSNKSSVNVNLLTTLEASRMEYLLSNGTSFANAKTQAQTEVLNMFFIQKPGMPESELLDISQDGDNNAVLLAMSLILQGYRTEAELSQLIGDISTDIRTDGVLNSPALGSALINDAKLFNLPAIRSNIENKYVSLGVTTVISNFEQYITQFIDSCNYTFTNYITYPSSGIYGVNILNETDSVFSISGAPLDFSCAANLPAGTSLKIIHTGNLLGFGYWLGSLDGWTDFGTDSTMVTRTFLSNRTGLINGRFNYGGGFGSSFQIFFYENGSLTPTRIKNIYIQ